MGNSYYDRVGRSRTRLIQLFHVMRLSATGPSFAYHHFDWWVAYEPGPNPYLAVFMPTHALLIIAKAHAHGFFFIFLVMLTRHSIVQY